MTYRPSVSRALISVRQMYEADSRAGALGITGLTLMEAAGAAVAAAILERYEPRPVLVLCGPGNNGGDGFVAARHLRAAGLSVDVAMAAPIDALSGDGRRMAEEWLRASGGIAQRPFGPDAVEEGEIVVDALFGAGLTRDLDGAYGDVVRAVDALGAPVVAVDIPSGICGDTGRVRGCAAHADLTVTFAAKKPGHVLLPGRIFCGETVVADIGIPASVLDEIAPEIFENDPSLWLDRFPAAGLEDHKYVRGHTLVLSGGVGKTGAARLAARGALRAGSGLVTIAPPSAALAEVAAQVTAIMTEPLDRIDDLGELLDRRRIRAAVVGPGNGIGPRTAAAVGLLLDAEVPTVIDADGLMSFETDPGALIGDLHDGAVLTPHAGEFDRLFKGLRENSASKLEAARAAAVQALAVIVLKGADTVIAAVDGRAIVNTNAPATLATAGSGDVLGGFIAGLMAQGMPSFEAAAAGVWLHGAAAEAFGPGLIAEDLPEMLPDVLHELHLLRMRAGRELRA